MSTTDAVLGVLALLAVLLCVALVAVALRRRLVPAWGGARARLVELLLGHVAAVVVSLLLGTAGLLGRPALLVAWGLLGTAAAVSLRRRGAASAPEPGPEEPLLLRLAAAGAVVVVAAQWLSVVPQTLRTGVLAVDAMHYHLTFAALFVQTGSTTELHRLNVPDPTTWYPLDDELLQGTAMALLGADTLVVVWQLVALGGTLLAAWVAGRAWGSGCLAVLAACVLLAVTGTAVGDANDWASLWPLLTAVALLALREEQPLLVGLAAGLAVGTKLTALPPAAVLAVAAVWVAASRARAAGLVAAGLTTSGGYWYVRTLLDTGTPLPQLGIGPGPPVPGLAEISASVLSYLDDGAVVRDWFLPGLRFALGVAWPALLLLALAGLVLALVRPALPGRRAAAVAGLATAAAYLVTPTSAGGLPGQPFLFVYNVRYALLALLLGLLLLATSAPALRRPLVPAGALLVLLATTVLRDGARPDGWAPTAVVGALAGVAALVLLVRATPRVRAGVVAASVLAGAAVAVPVQERYLDRRYADASDPRQALFLAAQDASDVGVVGFPRLYPLMGPRWETEVRYLGVERDDGAFVDARTCDQLLEVATGTDVVVVQRQNDLVPFPAARTWLRDASGVREVFDGELGTVFALGDDAACT